MEKIHAFLNANDVPGLAAWLEAMPLAERTALVRTISKNTQALLYEATSGSPGFDGLVPTKEPMVPVVHAGKNSLPLFSHFEKRFCRDGAGGMFGLNHGSTSAFTGPGYFLVHENGNELVFDYRELPKSVPSDWPAIRSNDGGIAGLVFGGMVDILRPVSATVSVGRAMKKGKAMDAWFLLCRQ